MVVQAPQSLPPAPPTPTILSPLPPASMDLSFYFGACIFMIALVAFFMCCGFISKYIFGARQDNDDDDNEEVSRNRDIEAGLTGSRTDDQPRSTTTHNQTQSHQVAAPQVKPQALSTTVAYFCGECVICLEEFKRRDKCLVLPQCGHMYHKACIDQWLSKNEHCPLCRGSICAMRIINRNQEV